MQMRIWLVPESALRSEMQKTENIDHTGRNNGLADLVQRINQALMDPHTCDDRSDLADPLSHHSRELWFCLRSEVLREGQLAGHLAVCD